MDSGRWGPNHSHDPYDGGGYRPPSSGSRPHFHNPTPNTTLPSLPTAIPSPGSNARAMPISNAGDPYADVPPPLPPPRHVPGVPSVPGETVSPGPGRNPYQARGSSSVSNSIGSRRAPGNDWGGYSLDSEPPPRFPPIHAIARDEGYSSLSSWRSAADNSMLKRLDPFEKATDRSPPQNIPSRPFASLSGATSSSHVLPTRPRPHGLHESDSSIRSNPPPSFQPATAPRHASPLAVQACSGFALPSLNRAFNETGATVEHTAHPAQRLGVETAREDKAVEGTPAGFEAHGLSQLLSPRDQGNPRDPRDTSLEGGMRAVDTSLPPTRLSSDGERERGDWPAGQKRRASSPPTDPAQLLRLRDGGTVSRGSPTPRLTLGPSDPTSHLAASSGRSPTFIRSASLLSTTSAPSVLSFGQQSPVTAATPSAIPPGPLSPMDQSTPTSAGITSASPTNLVTSPSTSSAVTLTSVLQSQPPHDAGGQGAKPLAVSALTASLRNLPAATAAAMNTPVPSSTLGKVQGFYICDCCPKKPKKFETQRGLELHKAEKQYGCIYCGNRFKNKNEAERHQNSLHVRRLSWSCARLISHDLAFHESPEHPGVADVCGYCGQLFARTGPRTQDPNVRMPSDTDWDVRMVHLDEVHKFKECNAAKKFYRADHFRQHLKHSHSGTSGKWTNMLEAACVMEEEPSQEPAKVLGDMPG